MFHHLLEVWFGWVLNGGYWGILALMAMESSIVPVPSEMVIPPAAFLAAQGHLNMVGVILAGTLGGYVGSAISYWLSRWVGRPFIIHFGKYFFISKDKFERTEVWLQRYETSGVFFARLLPVIRHLISIPAGVVRMNYAAFSAATITGAGIWCCVLAYLGAQVYKVQPDLISNPDAWVTLIKSKSIFIILFVFVIAALYLMTLFLTERVAVEEEKAE